MTEKDIFERVINALTAQDYHVDPGSLTVRDLQSDSDPLAKRIRIGMDVVSLIASMFTFGLRAELKPVFDNEQFRVDIKSIYPITNYVLFKYLLAQPIIAALVKADELEENDFKTIAGRYDKLILNFRKHTGSLLGTKLSVTGLLFFIFSNGQKAKEFQNKYQSANKKFHFWKKTWTIPWGIDIENRRVIKHKGLPILISVIDSQKLAQNIFT